MIPLDEMRTIANCLLAIATLWDKHGATPTETIDLLQEQDNRLYELLEAMRKDYK